MLIIFIPKIDNIIALIAYSIVIARLAAGMSAQQLFLGSIKLLDDNAKPRLAALALQAGQPFVNGAAKAPLYC